MNRPKLRLCLNRQTTADEHGVYQQLFFWRLGYDKEYKN